MKALFTRSLHLLLATSCLTLSLQAPAALFGIGEQASGLPAIALEADYNFYGETGKLSKLRARHLRPPYSLPVSTVAIIDELNEELDRRNAGVAPDVIIRDRLQWGRFEIFSVLKPMRNGRQIAVPTPVICKSRYNCRVDHAFEDRLSTEQRALLAWIRHYLHKNNHKLQLNDRQTARVTAEYQLFSIFDAIAPSTPAINLWLNMPAAAKPSAQVLDTNASDTAPADLAAIGNFALAMQRLPERELSETSPLFNQLLGEQLQTLFAGQYSYPFTRLSYNGRKPDYSRHDLSAVELAQELRGWQKIEALAHIASPDVRYVITRVNDDNNNLHVIPVACQHGRCEKLLWSQLRSTETRLLNHPLVLKQFVQLFENP